MKFKKIIGICILIFFILIFFIISTNSVFATHWIYGYVNDSYSGENADTHIVRIFCNTSARTDNVNDTIGATGNSGTANYYMVDVDGYCNWEVGDIMYADVFDSGDNYVATELVNVTTTATSDTMPNMRINSIPLTNNAYATDEVTPENKITFNANYSDDDNHSAQLFVCKDSSCTNCESGTTTNCWCYNSTSGTEPLTCQYTTSNSDSHTNNYWVKVYDERVYSSIIAGNDTSFLINHAPTITGVNLPTTSSPNFNLTCNYNDVSDTDSDSITVNYNWFENSTSLTVLNMPFDTRMPSDTSVYDFSGNENHGTVQGGASWTSNGKIGGGYKFSNVDSDYISIGNLNMGENWTIAFYLNQTNEPTAISYPIGVSGTYAGIFTRYDSQGDKWGVYDGSNVLLANSIVNLNEETFIAVVKNGTTYLFYQNGVNTATATGISTLTPDSLILGKRGNGYGISGTIDEVYIFNRSLTTEQIKSIYNNDLQKLVTQELQEGTNYSCSAVPIDQHGYNGTLQTSNNTYINYKPAINNVYITPYSPFAFDFLRCYFNVSDKDNSTNLKVNVTWYKDAVSWSTNDEQVSGISTNTLKWTTWTGTIKRISTSKSENWICSVNPYDGVSYGGWTNST